MRNQSEKTLEELESIIDNRADSLAKLPDEEYQQAKQRFLDSPDCPEDLKPIVVHIMEQRRQHSQKQN